MPIKPSPDLISKSITGALPKEQHDPFHPYKDFAASIPGAFTNMAQQGLQDYADAGVPVPGYAPQQGLSPDILKLLTLIPETSRIGGPPGLGAGGMFKVPARFSGGEISVLKNPSPERARKLLEGSKYKELRMIETPEGDVFVWPADKGLHMEVVEGLGIPTIHNGMALEDPAAAVFHNVGNDSYLDFLLDKSRRKLMMARPEIDINNEARDIADGIFKEIDRNIDAATGNATAAFKSALKRRGK